jgi:hypothetical protein
MKDKGAGSKNYDSLLDRMAYILVEARTKVVREVKYPAAELRGILAHFDKQGTGVGVLGNWEGNYRVSTERKISRRV